MIEILLTDIDKLNINIKEFPHKEVCIIETQLTLQCGHTTFES